MLLQRYSNIDYILNLNFQEGYELILKAYDKERESRAWDRWLIHYRYMDKKNFISFEDFKEKLFPKNTNTQVFISKEDMLKQAEEIERKITSKKRGD